MDQTKKPSRRSRCAACGILGLAVFTAGAQAAGTVLTTERIVSGLSSPVYLTAAPGDTERLFIVEQGGLIKIYDRTAGQVLALPFIAITVTAGGERGLLGLAFDPDYANNGYFYVNYTRTINNQLTTRIARFTVSAANPNRADPNSELIILEIEQPFGNHNAGWLEFGPDGYLYIATGDGGSGGDPGNRAQTITDQLLGKMLRIDVSNATPGVPYEVPPSNPFVGVAGDDEIWAYGLRNPWRNSFDRATGDLYIADVGQSAWEEVNYQPAGSMGGENYGWRCYEGNAAYNLSNCPPMSTMVFPIHVYSRSFGYSITGGYVYRGPKIWDLQGTYFFADYGSERIWSLRYDGTTVSDFRDRTSELAPGGGMSINNISSFGEDAEGELYIVDLGGEIYKIIPDGPVVGDMNGDGFIDNEDIDPFVLALTDPAAYQRAYPNIDPNVTGDINMDGVLDNEDIDPFVALLALFV